MESMQTGMFIIEVALYTVGGRLCIPTDVREELLYDDCHNSEAGGHRGADQMTRMLQRSGAAFTPTKLQ